jgi:hypothetical protein
MNPSNPNDDARNTELRQPGRDRMPVDESDNEAPGIIPQKPSSMPRAEDDEETFAHSPEFHDRDEPDSALQEKARHGPHEWE